jgi:hypothetical protein
LGPASAGHLSFPIEGVTLAVDMAAGGGWTGQNSRRPG